METSKTLACPVAFGDIHHPIMPPNEKQNDQTRALLFKNTDCLLK